MQGRAIARSLCAERWIARRRAAGGDFKRAELNAALAAAGHKPMAAGDVDRLVMRMNLSGTRAEAQPLYGTLTHADLIGATAKARRAGA